jgi:hypothetical protein
MAPLFLKHTGTVPSAVTFRKSPRYLPNGGESGIDAATSSMTLALVHPERAFDSNQDRLRVLMFFPN